MLSRIFIQNFALIDRLEISLHRGMQVITGETGAGKSIILGALRLILGERADVKAIADVEKKSIVETEFTVSDNLKAYFDEHDLDFEPHTIIRREILPSGKSRAFINDVPVTLDVLRGLTSQLIDIHSQFETSNLFTEEFQFKIIDGLSENKLLMPEYQQYFTEYQKLKRQLEHFKNQLAEGNKESDYRQFLLTELEELQLDDLDYDELQNQLALQENAGMITENLGEIIAKFHMEELGFISALNDCRIRLNRIAEISPNFSEVNDRLEQSYVELKDLLSDLEDQAERVEVDPELLSALNTTNNRLNALFLKHSVTSAEELKQIRDQIAGEQSGFADLENNIAETAQKIATLQEKLTQLSAQLSANRQKAATIFSEKIKTLLQQLGLEKAKTQVELIPAPEFNQFGKEKIAILFQANSGFPLKPIQTAISGGERSRVMLAVKKIMAENTELPTLILDEIDTGVSGRIAEEMGKVMSSMSADLQLIVITHLAQVAAKGNDHYKVIKQDIAGRTQSNILPLNAEEKLSEIAQLLSGSRITEAALAQAKELMG